MSAAGSFGFGVTTVAPWGHLHHLCGTTAASAFMSLLTFLSSLLWRHWSPLARLPNFIFFHSTPTDDRPPIASLLCLRPASLYVDGLLPICCQPASVPLSSLLRHRLLFLVTVFIIVIVHPLFLQSWHIYLFMWLDLSSFLELFSFILLRSVHLKYVIFMFCWLSSCYIFVFVLFHSCPCGSFCTSLSRLLKFRSQFPKPNVFMLN
jgi:hypothetical protein